MAMKNLHPTTSHIIVRNRVLGAASTTMYSKQIITTVACLFPELYGSQILDCEGRGETRLRSVVSLVVKFRCEAQQWLLALRGRL